MEDDLIPVETSVIQQLESAAVVQQLDAAHKYPQHRSTKQRQEIIAELKSECTATREIAEECEYSLPRGKTSIKGPSVHLMRAVASRFGNIQKGARIIGIEDRVVRAQGVAWDLEMNVRMSVEVQRRITGKDGKRFNDDMINTTAMAALAIAERNAIKSVIPKSIWGPVYEAVVIRLGEQAGIKDDLGESRRRAKRWFESRGIPEEAMLAKVGVTSMGELTMEKLRDLSGIKTQVEQEMATIEEIFEEFFAGKDASDAPDAEKPKRTAPEPTAEPASVQKPAAPENATEPKEDFEENPNETKIGNPEWEAKFSIFQDLYRSLTQAQKDRVRAISGVHKIRAAPSLATILKLIPACEQVRE